MIINSDHRLDDDACCDCSFYDGEECQGNLHEGKERYDDSEACEEFEPMLNA
jgi:hypothetical protein